MRVKPELRPVQWCQLLVIKRSQLGCACFFFFLLSYSSSSCDCIHCSSQSSFPPSAGGKRLPHLPALHRHPPDFEPSSSSASSASLTTSCSLQVLLVLLLQEEDASLISCHNDTITDTSSQPQASWARRRGGNTTGETQ